MATIQEMEAAVQKAKEDADHARSKKIADLDKIIADAHAERERIKGGGEFKD